MTNEVVTIYRNGEPFVSYKPNGHNNACVGNIPWQLTQAIASSLGYKGRPTMIAWDRMTTTSPEPTAFVARSPFSMLIGTLVATHSASFIDAISIPFEFEVKWWR